MVRPIVTLFGINRFLAVAEEHQTAQGYHAFVNGVFGLQAVENIYSQPVANQHHSIERLKTEQSNVAELLAAEIVRARAGSTTLPPDPLAWMDVDVEEDMRLIDNVELLVRTAVGKLAADAGPKRNAANSLKATVLYIESNLGRLRDPNESIICPHRYLTPPVQLRADREGLGRRRLRDEGPEFAEELRRQQRVADAQEFERSVDEEKSRELREGSARVRDRQRQRDDYLNSHLAAYRRREQERFVLEDFTPQEGAPVPPPRVKNGHPMGDVFPPPPLQRKLTHAVDECDIVVDHRRHQRSAVVWAERRDGEGEQDGIPQTPGGLAGEEEGQQAVAVREDQVLAVFDLGGPRKTIDPRSTARVPGARGRRGTRVVR